MPTLITTSGKDIITNRLLGGGTSPSFIEIGKGATPPDASNTTLQTPISPRIAGSASRATTTSANDTFRVTGTIGNSITYAGAITEVGLFDALSSGNLFLRSTFSAINLTAVDSISFTFNIQFA
jgi:hypothetical protein